jgi:hypothetical protein
MGRYQMPKPVHICESCSRKNGDCSLKKIHEVFIASGEMQTVLCTSYSAPGSK